MALWVLRSANRFSVDPACSNTDQKSAAARNSTPMTQSFLRSSDDQLPLVNNQPKNKTTIASSKIPAPSATCLAVIGIAPV